MIPIQTDNEESIKQDNLINNKLLSQQSCVQEESSSCSSSKDQGCLECSPKEGSKALPQDCSCSQQSKVKQLFNSAHAPTDSSNSQSELSIVSPDLLSTNQKPAASNSNSLYLEDEKKSTALMAHKNSAQSMKEGKEEGLEVNAATQDVIKTGNGKARGHMSLPADIPTLDSLAQSCPKLSTWRQTRIISEKLEQHLWTWRCACKKSGKRISKSLLQARAKWAFRKAGIVEFKVISNPRLAWDSTVMWMLKWSR